MDIVGGSKSTAIIFPFIFFLFKQGKGDATYNASLFHRAAFEEIWTLCNLLQQLQRCAVQARWTNELGSSSELDATEWFVLEE